MPDENPNQNDAKSYEELIESLEDIVEKIESGEIGLEQAIDAYEQGARLIAQTRAILTKAEQRIESIDLEALKKSAEEDV